jgi:tetratricopeptide (TPR) repeat protein
LTASLERVQHIRREYKGDFMRGLALCLCLLGLGGRAHADDDSVAAKHHFESAMRLFNVGEFDEAAKEYREAYKLKPDPVLLYNAGQSYRLAKNAEQALFFYRSFLRNAPDAKNRAEVEGRIRVLEEQVKQQQAPPNDVVKPAPPVESRPVEATPETAAPVAPQLTSAPRADLVTTAPPRPKPVYKKWWVWSVAGVAVVGVGLGVGLGLGLRPGAPNTPLGNYRLF